VASKAKYYANFRDGKNAYLCSDHLQVVAKKLDDAGHLALKRGVKRIGSLSPYTPKTCTECPHSKE
jgi:hypothetical protein